LALVGSSATSLDPIGQASEAVPATRRLAAIACVAFLLIGWSGLLVPSLIRSVKTDFVQSDAGLGLFYLVGAIFYAAGSFGGGLVTERVGRRFVLSGAAILIGIGLAAQAAAPSWTVFLIAAAPAGLGSGVVDGGMNGLILDLFRRRPGGALNLLHLFFSLGAAGSPLIVGQLVAAAIDWRTIVLATAVVAVVVGVVLALQVMPTGRHVRPSRDEGTRRAPDTRRPVLPLVLLALAIAFYVSSEIGVSSWLVRFLESASNDVATMTLAAFWGGLALGRLLAARVADRFRPVRFATACALGAAIALLGAIVVPWLPLSIALFALSGFAFGPVYPMIMTIGGALYPGRLAAVTGGLAGSAVVGGIVYPPLMGFISVEAGIGVAMFGAGLLALACAGGLIAASVAARRLLGSTTG
jgi:fucose permease